ncbi:MAG: glycosyltransferase [Egibacteraceae bacterium]
MTAAVEHAVANAPDVFRDQVTLAVVTWNSAALISDFVSALPAALRGVDSYELVVADNASADDTLEAVRTCAPTATVVALDRNGGYAAGVNAAVAAATESGAVLVLNPDVLLRPGSVRALLDTLAQPGVGIAVPRMYRPDGRLYPSLRREPTVARALGEALLGMRAGRWPALGETVLDPDRYEQAASADWAVGAALLISRDCLRTVGPWDETFFHYSEETDFCLRARDLGFDLRLAPGAEVVHSGGESGTARLRRMLVWNKVRLHRQRHGAVRASGFRCALILGEALRAAIGRRLHRAGLAALLIPGCRPPEVRAMPAGRPRCLRDDATPGYICFAAQDWWYHNHAHSDFQLMRGIARQRKVLVVNSIGMRMPMPGRSTQPLRRIARKVRSITKLVRRPVPDLPNFFVMTPLSLPLYGSAVSRAVVAALVRAQVRIVARALGLRTPVCFVTIPTAWDVIRRMRWHSVVFNRSDRHSAFPDADRDVIRRLEAALLRRSDHVLYASRTLMAEEAPVVGDRGVFLDHGVDLGHFVYHPPDDEPEDLRRIPRPRIGFFGGLDDYRVDLGLLEKVAQAFPDAQLVLIGDAVCSMQRLAALPNVHWLGYRPYEEIPRYGSGFDVALLPCLDNEFIRCSNPIKLKEYLALGLPVVSTDFPEVRRYAQWIGIASDHQEFVALIHAALADGAQAQRSARRAAVADASWEQRVHQLIEVIAGQGVQRVGDGR